MGTACVTGAGHTSLSVEYKCGFQLVRDGVGYCGVDWPLKNSPYKVEYPYDGVRCEEMLKGGNCPEFKTFEEVDESTWLHRMTF